MKKFIKILALTITVLMLSVPVFASSNIKVQLNGKYLDFTDEQGNKVEPQIINDRTMVPMRKIFEVFGADVEWIGETRSIKANTEELEIVLQIDNKIATVKNISGEVKQIELDSVPVIREGRTLVPVRFIAESLDKKVGWDNYNKTVIIIDLDIIENTLKEKTPNFYEYLSIVPEKMTTAEMSLELDGKLKMESETLNIDGKMDMKVSKKAMAFEIDIEFNGSKNIMQEIENLEKISIDVVLDMENFVAYIKSPLIEDYKNKWIKYAAELSEEELLEAKKLITEYFEKQNGSIIDVLSIFIAVNENLTITSYSELESILQIVCMVMNNDNFTVSGTNEKTYKFKFGFKDLVNKIGFVGSLEEIEEQALFDISLDVKMKNGIAKESKFYLLFGEKINGVEESIELTLKSTIESYNEEVNITIPSGKNIIDGNKMYEKESSRAVEQAMFSGFVQEMGELQDNMTSSMLYAKGTEALKGNARSEAQLYNFVARGGYKVITEESDEKWLLQSNAKDIPCTLINKEYAEDSLGAKLPVRKVETAKGTNQEASYFVTPMGNVFCWPPYIYDGKSYVNYETTVKDKNGNELALESTENNQVFIPFENTGELVVVSNKSNDTAIVCEKYTGNIGNVGVWYPKVGTVLGIDFTKYINNSMDVATYNKEYIKPNFDITINTEKDIVLPTNKNDKEINKERFVVSNFNDFNLKMDELQDAVVLAMLTAKGNEVLMGNQRTEAQLYNFVARGGVNVLDYTEEGMAKWLFQSDARVLPCTKINEEYALDMLGEPLPIIKVNTAKSTKEEAAFFVTPMGNVFCWPPYEYNGKSYINSNTLVTDENGKNITSKEATKKNKITLIFSNGESVIVSNEKNVEPGYYQKNDEAFDGIGVWYPKDKVVLGIDFSKYDNRNL